MHTPTKQAPEATLQLYAPHCVVGTCSHKSPSPKILVHPPAGAASNPFPVLLIAQIGGSLQNQEYPQYDIGIAAEHFCLQATELGLGTCMLGWFNQKKIKQLINIPRNRKIGLVITLGYAPDDYKQRKKILLRLTLEK